MICIDIVKIKLKRSLIDHLAGTILDEERDRLLFFQLKKTRQFNYSLFIQNDGNFVKIVNFPTFFECHYENREMIDWLGRNHKNLFSILGHWPRNES